MVFNSVFFFLTLVPLLLLYYTRRQKRCISSKVVVLLYSYVFYGMWNPAFLLLIWTSTVIDYVAARSIETWPRRKTLFLLSSLVTNLGLLGFFKYFDFFSRTLAYMLSSLSIQYTAPLVEVLLPVGISFYTFQTLSYTIDVYREKLPARRSLLDVAVFVAFFPQLVAGPIVRASHFFPQLDKEPEIRSKAIADGIFLILCGLFLKAVIADNVALRVDVLFANWRSIGSAGSWAAAMLFGVQIYCDFSAYSLIAIGLAGMMGFEIPQNFNAPYGASGMSDFWRRWHISLSSWLKDYLYIPLGGNRKSKFRTMFNIMTTMVLGGLWHGASIMFVLWGAIHGLALIVERLIRQRIHFSLRHRLSRSLVLALTIVLTYLVVSAAWIPFRARSAQQCLGMLGQLFHGPLEFQSLLYRDFAVIFVVFFAHIISRRYNFIEHAGTSPILRFTAVVGLTLSLYFLHGHGTEFIYFQF